MKEILSDIKEALIIICVIVCAMAAVTAFMCVMARFVVLPICMFILN